MSVSKKKITFITQIIWMILSPKKVVTWMPERSCVRTPFGSQRVKWLEKLLKCAWQTFYVNFPWISNKLKCVSWLLVKCEILGPFSNTFTGDHKDSHHNWEKFLQQVRQQLSSKPKTFSASFVALLKFA